jgi:RimJ/RimL family protein N-acetyltransferase
MSFVDLHDREEIASTLLRDPILNIYGIGDLDDRFFPFTTWFGRRSRERIEEIAFVYSHTDLPVLIALTRGPVDGMLALLAGITPRLPRRIYAHTSPGVITALLPAYRAASRGEHLRMSLDEPRLLRDIEDRGAVPLGPDDLTDAVRLYAASYPENWFDPWMITTGCYYGIRESGSLVAVAGVHVVSARRGVAALGNIATHPDRRGRGLAKAATAALARHLIDDLGIARIGLNVKAGNAPAIACYAKLGFRQAATYEESMCEAL